MKNKDTIRRIIKLLFKYKLKFIMSLLLAVSVVVSTLFIPILIGYAVDTFIGKGEVLFTKLFRILIQMLIALIITGSSQWLMTIINNNIVYNLVKDLRTEAFSKIHTLDVLYIDTHQQGEIINRIVNDIDQFSEGLLLGFANFFTGVLTIIITLIFMFILNFTIAILVVVLTPISLIVTTFIAKYSYKHFQEQSICRAKLSSISDEMIEALFTIKNFGTEDLVSKRFNEIDKALGEASTKAIFYSAAAMPSTRAVNSIIYMAIAVIGGVFTLGSYLSVGNLTSFLSYASTYTKPFNEISGVITELQNSIACATRVFEFIDEKDMKKDNYAALELSNISGDVKVEDIEFSYTKDKDFIKDFSLDVKRGQKIAIVGPTGCGKTTFINLLMRFYEIDKGDIKVDENSIFNIKRNNLHTIYGMVFQDTWLKNTTIRENIAMSKPNATFEEIEKAAKLANADGFIKRLPNSYDTIVSLGGDSLSAGQRQLICIARIMLMLPPMLILDEATSSIDTRTELKISKAFDKLMENRTSFIVAHRLSTIKGADLILVMKDGKIIEKGNHDSLLAKGGFYKELYNSQFSTT